jgi:hypothetical protein
LLLFKVKCRVGWDIEQKYIKQLNDKLDSIIRKVNGNLEPKPQLVFVIFLKTKDGEVWKVLVVMVVN